jgi:oxygen-independent coproporphyrinogen III oxidase
LILIKEARRSLAEHAGMTTPDPIALGAHLHQRVPRYAAYPSPASFHEGVSETHYDAWLASLPKNAWLAVRLHIPFCERVCWYCYCRTQAVRNRPQVDAYLDSLTAEIARSAARLPADARVERVTWAGGSPTSLAPDQIARLADAVRTLLPMADRSGFAVEIDPAGTGERKLDALAEAGLTRAILGVQDFDPAVQAAIGRAQRLEQIEATLAGLRARGVSEIAIQQLYGLPIQTRASVANASRAIAEMAPDLVEVTGYAHVPWLAKRQRVIAEQTLPDIQDRLAQFGGAAAIYRLAGFEGIGTDTFARPGSPLARAARAGRLRRSVDGYAAGLEDAQIGFGAGAISQFRQGYVQNLPQTRAYREAVAGGGAAAGRGAALTLEDKVRARAIEMLMCSFRIDLAEIRAEFGDFVGLLEDGCHAAVARFRLHVAREGDVLRIERDGPVLARLVARLFDTRSAPTAHYGMAI